jgi:hypothetical protein
MELLRDVTDEFQIEEALKAVPATDTNPYFDLYEKSMARINTQTRNRRALGLLVLKWIVSTESMLSVDELLNLLTVDPKDTPTPTALPTLYNAKRRRKEANLVAYCAGLVVLEPQSRTVRLVHFTAKEYFDRTASRYFPDANLDIAKSCLLWKSFDPDTLRVCKNDDQTQLSTTEETQDARYVGEFWVTHLVRCRKDWDADTKALLRRRMYGSGAKRNETYANCLCLAMHEGRLGLVKLILEASIYEKQDLMAALEEAKARFNDSLGHCMDSIAKDFLKGRELSTAASRFKRVAPSKNMVRLLQQALRLPVNEYWPAETSDYTIVDLNMPQDKTA